MTPAEQQAAAEKCAAEVAAKLAEAPAPAGFLSDIMPGAFVEEPPPVPHLLRQYVRGYWRPWMPRGVAGILAAGGGVGKTWLALQLIVSLLTGRDWLGMKTVRADACAIVLAEEDLPEAQRRLYAIGVAMGLTAEEHEIVRRGLWIEARLGFACSLLEKTKAQNLTPTDYAGELFDRLRASGREFSIVILDPAVHFFPADAEIDNAVGAQAMRACARFCTLPGKPTTLVTHHVTKTSLKEGEPLHETDIRGAGAIVTTARWAAACARVGEDGAFHLEVVKVNGVPSGVPVMLERIESGPLQVRS